MFESQVLLYGDGNEIWSPWMARGGDNVRCTIDVTGLSGANLTVRLFTKNSEDGGAGSDVDLGTSISATTTGQTTQEWTVADGAQIKEMVRYKFTVGGTNAADWIQFRMLNPVWFDTLNA
jgi:hypothetical protein